MICLNLIWLWNIFQAIHDAGGFVKIAFGGQNADIPSENLNHDELDLLIQRIVNLIDNYELDGVEFTYVSLWTFKF